METKATYGNNPYQKMKKVKGDRKQFGTAREKKVISTFGSKSNRARSLFEMRENVEMSVKLEDMAGVEKMVDNEQEVEEEQVWEDVKLMDVVNQGEEGFSMMIVHEDPDMPGTYLLSIPEQLE